MLLPLLFGLLLLLLALLFELGDALVALLFDLGDVVGDLLLPLRRRLFHLRAQPFLGALLPFLVHFGDDVLGEVDDAL